MLLNVIFLASAFMRKLALSINEAMSISQQTNNTTEAADSLNTDGGDIRTTRTTEQTKTKHAGAFVHKVTLVRGLPFYGYTAEERFFVKIFIYPLYYMCLIGYLLIG